MVLLPLIDADFPSVSNPSNAEFIALNASALFVSIALP